MEGDRRVIFVLRLTLFGGESSRGKPRNPRQGSSIGEAEVVGEGEDE